MINREVKEVLKEALFQGLFWIVSIILFGLLAIKLIVYVYG